MDDTTNERRWRSVLLTGLFVFVAGFYWGVLKSPDKVVLNGAGDGLKNYYTLLWQANNDTSLLHYSGSNFPFGESVFYTDGHPLLSWLIRWLPGLSAQGVGVLNLLLFLGLIACGLCLYELLRTLRVVPWASAVGAFSITVLQPQVFRLGGHFSLAHAWMIPLFLLLSVRLHRAGTTSWRPAVWASLAVVVAFLTHAYLGLMGTMLLLAHGFSHFMLGGFRRAALRTFFTRTLPAAGVPMLVFLLLLWLSETASGRPSGNLGADRFATQFLNLIVPLADPFKTPLKDFINYDQLEWEAWCYLGLSSILVLVVAGGLQLHRWSMHQPAKAMDEAGHLLAGSFLVLLFAMGVWQDLLGNRVPFLDQFRSTGRFAWPFFFASAVFCTVRCHDWLIVPSNSRKRVAIPAFIVVVGFMAVEGWAYHRDMHWVIGQAGNPFREDGLNDDQRALVQAARASGASAIMPQPWVHFGSEEYDASAPEGILARAMPLAYHSDIPMLAGFTSRTSLTQTRMLFALLAPTYYPKQLRRFLPDTTRILLLQLSGPTSPREDTLWAHAEPVIGNAAGSLRMITAGELTNDDRKAHLQWYGTMRDSMPAQGPWRFSNGMRLPAKDIASQVRFGPDSLSGHVNEWHELVRLEPGTFDTSITYQLNFRYETPDPWAVNINLVLLHETPEATGGIWEELLSLRSMPMQLAEGVAVCSFNFKPHFPGKRYKILLNGPAKVSSPFTIHDVVLRPLDVDVWRDGTWEGGPTVFLNGLPLTYAGSPAASP
ncbi:MAG: hypothetical protein KBH07_11565 [Flavobacteriales bacterium]|nr:hypothetical protein [Flavobacteriales bacterium]MBP9080813.1 hypothetical protein [Flavobacteriales bacterium]